MIDRLTGALDGAIPQVFHNHQQSETAAWWPGLTEDMVSRARAIDPSLIVRAVFANPELVAGGQRYDVCCVAKTA